jgi:hypothetical protein
MVNAGSGTEMARKCGNMGRSYRSLDTGLVLRNRHMRRMATLSRRCQIARGSPRVPTAIHIPRPHPQSQDPNMRRIASPGRPHPRPRRPRTCGLRGDPHRDIEDRPRHRPRLVRQQPGTSTSSRSASSRNRPPGPARPGRKTPRLRSAPAKGTAGAAASEPRLSGPRRSGTQHSRPLMWLYAVVVGSKPLSSVVVRVCSLRMVFNLQHLLSGPGVGLPGVAQGPPGVQERQ